MTPVVLVGAGELARLALSFLRDIDELEPVACAVGAAHLEGAVLGDLPVVALEELESAFPAATHEVLVCVGYRRVNRGREELVRSSSARGYRLATIVHPSAWVSPDAEVGANCIVFPRAVVEPFTELGDGVVVWSGGVVAHDCRIGDFCFLAPNATVAGNVTLGERCFVGANATVRDGVTLGADCVVGAGALVKHDTEPGSVFPAAGTPVGRRSSSGYDTL